MDIKTFFVGLAYATIIWIWLLIVFSVTIGVISHSVKEWRRDHVKVVSKDLEILKEITETLNNMKTSPRRRGYELWNTNDPDDSENLK